MSASVSRTARASTEFLSFTLGGVEYGLEFDKVHELRQLKSLDRVAAEGTLISAVAVSRGVVMPLVDMRAALDTRAAPAGPLTDVVILELAGGLVGMLVESVTDVVALRADQIAPLPGAAGQVDYLLGIGETAGRRLILVDIDRLMAIKQRVEA
jgi:purine-binding chemotaxis protein CheW